MVEVELYFDVDGVVSPLGHAAPRDWGWGGFETTWASGLHVLWAPELVERLNDLTSVPGVGTFWLTSWEDDAPRDLCPAIGLRGEHWPVLGAEGCYESTTPGTWWKHAALADHIARSQPLDPAARPARVWVDDDLATEPKALAWASERAREQPRPFETIVPLTRRGLTRADVEHLERFVQTHT